MLNNLKQTLIDKISSTEDENLIKRLNDEFDYFSRHGTKDILDDLSPEDYKELIDILNEPEGFETESFEDFKKATARWRKK